MDQHNWSSTNESEHITLTRGVVWELTTENGTRHLIDLREGRMRRMRIPADPNSGIPALNNRWLPPLISIWPVDYDECRQFGPSRRRENATDFEVQVGRAAYILSYPRGMWDLTTNVVDVRVFHGPIPESAAWPSPTKDD